METSEGAPDPVRRVREFVEREVSEVRSLGDLAEVAGLSRYHFARRFHDETGETPWAYVRRIRAEQAVELLEAGRRPGEVAYEVGYADQPHLTRSLRAWDGRTPGEIYRASREQGEAAPAKSGDRKDVQDRGSGAE